MLTSIIIATFIALCGCETEPTDQIALQISPNNAKLRVGQSQEFTATGFTDYRWELSDNKIGVLSTTAGSSTIYTAIVKASNEVQVLTVSATSLAGTTNSITASAEALITNY
jgi:hypothetical protein